MLEELKADMNSVKLGSPRLANTGSEQQERVQAMVRQQLRGAFADHVGEGEVAGRTGRVGALRRLRPTAPCTRSCIRGNR